MTVRPISDELLVDLAGVGETMAREWAESVGEDGQAILDALQ